MILYVFCENQICTDTIGSAFISYRVLSELPLARLLFDELNHTVTPGGHRVTVYWDAHRLVKVRDLSNKPHLILTRNPFIRVEKEFKFDNTPFLEEQCNKVSKEDINQPELC